jgi:hypothetical protein
VYTHNLPVFFVQGVFPLQLFRPRDFPNIMEKTREPGEFHVSIRKTQQPRRFRRKICRQNRMAEEIFVPFPHQRSHRPEITLNQ